MKYTISDGSISLMNNLLCVCDVWKGRSYVNSTVSVPSIFNNGQLYYFLHYRNPPPSSPHSLKGFSQVSIATTPFSFFTKMLKPLQFVIFIALGEKSQSLPKNVPYWRQHCRYRDIIFGHIFQNTFLYYCFFSIGYR